MSDILSYFLASLAQIAVATQAMPAVPQDYIDKGWVTGNECGQYTDMCWGALRREGFGPLAIDKRSGETWLRAMGRTLKCESRLDPARVYINRDGSRDRGIAQWNDRHWPKVSDEMAFNTWYAISRMAREFRRGNQQYWVCYQILFL